MVRSHRWPQAFRQNGPETRCHHDKHKCYHDDMIRMQVQVTEAQATALRRMASATGRSTADLVRQGVDLYLTSQKRPGREELVRRGLAASGRFASGSKVGSAEHDRYLAEAFGG